MNPVPVLLAPVQPGAARISALRRRVAIVGASGFVGGHLARVLAYEGHPVVLLSRHLRQQDPRLRRLPQATYQTCAIHDEDRLAAAFVGCDAVAVCAGLSREAADNTFAQVHVAGTRAVARAASRAGLRRVVLVSYLHARPDCRSAYHETKWEAEEILRASGLDYTIVKPGVVYGRGDHLVSHLYQAVQHVPLFATVGCRARLLAPLAVEDLTRVLQAALVDDRLLRSTVAVTGPETLTLAEMVRRVGLAVGSRPLLFRAPGWVHRLLAWTAERIMREPLLASSQVKILAEGAADPLPGEETLPADLVPRLRFEGDQIWKALPALSRRP